MNLQKSKLKQQDFLPIFIPFQKLQGAKQPNHFIFYYLLGYFNTNNFICINNIILQ